MPLCLNKIKVQQTHTKNTSANNYYLIIDAFEVKQPLYTIDLRKMLPKGTKDYIDKVIGNLDSLPLTQRNNVSEAILSHINSNIAHSTYVPLKTTVNITYYVSTTGSDLNDGLTANTPFRTIQHAFDILPQIINNTVTVIVAAGTYNEDVVIRGFVGKGYIHLLGASSLVDSSNYIVKSVTVIACAVTWISVKGFTGTQTGGTAFIHSSNNCEVDWVYLTVNASDATSAAFNASYASVAYVSACSFSNRNQAIIAQGTKVISKDVTGSGNSVGLYSSNGSDIAKSGTQPSGTTMEYTTAGGVIR